jgi:hypothetical protein
MINYIVGAFGHLYVEDVQVKHLVALLETRKQPQPVSWLLLR